MLTDLPYLRQTSARSRASPSVHLPHAYHTLYTYHAHYTYQVLIKSSLLQASARSRACSSGSTLSRRSRCPASPRPGCWSSSAAEGHSIFKKVYAQYLHEGICTISSRPLGLPRQLTASAWDHERMGSRAHGIASAWLTVVPLWTAAFHVSSLCSPLRAPLPPRRGAHQYISRPAAHV